MWIHVNPRSNTPMYQQIIDGVKEQIARGQLEPGDRLLTVREMATRLSVNHNTVAKAYQELERNHVVELIQGRGTFVSGQSPTPDAVNRKRELREAMRKWLVDAHHLQISEHEIVSMLQELLIELRNPKGVESP
ncbi:MAG: GntR family transcriptional regulator [Bacilli bacterium]